MSFYFPYQFLMQKWSVFFCYEYNQSKFKKFLKTKSLSNLKQIHMEE